jgi:DNA invertase Pin-like site-specific DNA recombinase
MLKSKKLPRFACADPVPEQFTDIESGKHNDRPKLEKALAACKRQKARLVIAKLDRLSRNLAFNARLMDSLKNSGLKLRARQALELPI